MHRRVAAAILGIAGIAAASGAWLGAAALRAGAGYKAKSLCSGVFVSNRTPDALLAETTADDLAVLRFFDSAIDRPGQAVTVSAPFHLLERRAVYRDGLGCALILDGRTPPSLSISESPLHAASGDAFASDGQASPAAAAVVDRAFDEPDPQRPRRTLAVLISRGDRIVAERYAPGIGPATPLPGWSMAKSVLNALAGILVGRGRLALDGPLPVPEWQQPGDQRARITLGDLLRMSSGLRVDESDANPRGDAVRMLFETPDAAAYAASRPLAFAPGAHWEYSNGGPNIVSRAMRAAVGSQKEYLELPRRALFDPLGMSSAVMETDPSGTFVASSFIYASARDWARFGRLYLQDGVWNGERILPEGWVSYTRTPAPADAAHRYGAFFWIQIPDVYGGADPRLPVPAFHAAGHEGQFVTIVPSLQVVIVRLGRTRHHESWDQAAFVRDVLRAIDGEPRP